MGKLFANEKEFKFFEKTTKIQLWQIAFNLAMQIKEDNDVEALARLQEEKNIITRKK